MRLLSASEHDRHLHLRPVAQEPLDVTLLRLVVMDADLRAELDLLDLDLRLVLARGLGLLLLLVLVLAVVHDPGHGRVGACRDLDQVQILGVGVLERLGRRLDADLRAVRIDQPHARDTDGLVDPCRVLLRPGLLEPAPRPH
jgi:hypothetical protein